VVVTGAISLRSGVTARRDGGWLRPSPSYGAADRRLVKYQTEHKNNAKQMIPQNININGVPKSSENDLMRASSGFCGL